MRAAAIAFLGGILVVQQLAALPSLFSALALIPAVALAFWHPRWLVVVFFVAGFIWVGFRAELILHQRLVPELEGRDIVVEGVVAGLPQPTQYGTRFAFDVKQARLDGVPVFVPGRIRLSAGRDLRAQAGDRWRLTVRLKRPHGLQNPGGFDYEAYLFRERLRATGYVRSEPLPARLGEGGGLYRIHRLRQQLGSRMRALMPENAYAGLIVALANGDQGGVTDEQWETLNRTGTLHLVAISGLHISLIAGLTFWLVRFLWALPGTPTLWLPAPLAGALGGFGAACVYAALAGFVIPTQRALIMLAVAMGAVLVRRRPAPSQTLAAALLVVLLYDPFAVMAPGFWLSFLAVAVIIYVVYAERGGRTLWRKWGQLQWAIAVGMLPLMLWLFQRTSLVAPAANLLAVPVFELAVVPVTLAGALGAGLGLDGLAAWLFQAGGALLGWLWRALAFLASFEYAQWVQHRPPAWTLLCGLLGAALLLAPRGWPARTIGGVWLLPIFLVHPAVPGPGEVWFTLLDVGQGLAAVVRTETRVLVYDTGARWSARADAGRSVVIPYLRTNGITRIDTLLVSHGDNDHAGGAASVVRALPVGRVLSGAPDVAGEPCRAGQRWRWDGVEFALLGPPGPPGDSNDASCVLHVRGPYGAILLPGDIEATAEHSLVQRAGERLRADILIAPHHGSRTSSSAEFLDAVRPRHVAFPVGYRNRYRHPHALVVERYRTRGVQLHDSPSGGALEFRLRADGIDLSAYRARARRYWFAQPELP